MLLAVSFSSCQNHAGETRRVPSPRELDFTGRATPITAAQARRVTSIRLTRRISPRVRAACRAAKMFTCPHLVPAGGIAPIRDIAGPAETGRDIYVLSFNNGTIHGYTHWIVGAGTRGALSRSLIDDRDHEVKGLPKRIRLIRLGVRRIALYRFPAYPSGGYLGGHTAAFADLGPRVVFASVHGDTHADADVALVADMLGP